MIEIILIGGGGHALSCLDVILSTGKHKILGYVDPVSRGEWMGIPWLGDDSVLPQLLQNCRNVFIGIGQIESSNLRTSIIRSLKERGALFPTIIAPTAYVSPLATLGEGTIVMEGAHVGPGAIIGEHCILNTKSIVEHGVRIGDYVHVSTGAIVNGDVEIGEKVFIGSSSVICQGIKVPSEKFVQANQFIGKKYVWQ